jgi:putative flippase GtrA
MRSGLTAARTSMTHAAPAGLIPAQALLRHTSVMLPQLWRYGIVSALALTLDFGVFLAFNHMLSHPTLAGMIGYSTGIILHFFLSRRFVFDAATAKAVHRVFIEFLGSGLVGLVVTAGVIAIATSAFGLEPIAAKALAVGTSFVGVFIIRRFIVFV